MSKLRRKYQTKAVIVAAVIIIITTAAYWGVWRNGFVDFDDNEYITRNPQVQQGLTAQGVRWAFTTKHASNWHPLTWLSHMLDCQLFELNAAGHHTVGLALHIANALLLFWAIKLMTADLWKGAFVAVLFAIHPLHVESVAWAAERKDVLSALFWMLTMIAYARYAKARAARWYILALLAFAVGLLAKPMLVTLPFVLLLLDYWPLERMALRKGGSVPAKSITELVIEKVPFFILAGLSSIATMYAQQAGGAVKGFWMLSLKFRIGNAIVTYISYIGKMFVPKGLIVFYPHPGDGISWAKVAIAAVVLICISVIAVVTARKRGWLLVGWCWFIGTLVPVVGLVQVGAQAMADRYTYMPLTGLFIIVTWSTTELLQGRRYGKQILTISAAAVIIVLAALTFLQVRYWQDDFTLFGRAVAVDGDNYTGHFNLARAFSKAGHADKAFEHYKAAARIEPDSPQANHNLAIQLFRKGKIDASIKYYKRALRLDNSEAKMHYNIGTLIITWQTR